MELGTSTRFGRRESRIWEAGTFTTRSSEGWDELSNSSVFPGSMRLAGVHPVDIALERVGLAVVRNGGRCRASRLDIYLHAEWKRRLFFGAAFARQRSLQLSVGAHGGHRNAPHIDRHGFFRTAYAQGSFDG